MKILGITDIGGKLEFYLKPDSALLVGRKPFFLPETAETLIAKPCLVVKINRLGRCIEEKFASRYYDEFGLGLNLQYANVGQMIRLSDMLKSTAFDGSLVVGDFCSKIEMVDRIELRTGGNSLLLNKLICSVEQAIAKVSETITLRMGDMIAVDFAIAPLELMPKTRIEGFLGEENKLTLKVI